MIVKRDFPRSFEELKAVVMDAAKGARSVAVQAGHFLVYYDHTEDQLLPCIASELIGPRHEVIKAEVGHFPQLTWEVGIDLLQTLPAVSKYIMVLVNDWQYLPDGVDRSRFYEKSSRLPVSYRSVLDRSRGHTVLLKPPRVGNELSTGDFFSERTLRRQYGKHVGQLISDGALPPNTELIVDGEALSCNLVDVLGSRQEIYCTRKSANCTHEVAELLYGVSTATKCDLFINIYPLVCKEYVEAGTELGIELFANSPNVVFNVGFPSSELQGGSDLYRNAEVTLHRR